MLHSLMIFFHASWSHSSCDNSEHSEIAIEMGGYRHCKVKVHAAVNEATSIEDFKGAL